MAARKKKGREVTLTELGSMVEHVVKTVGNIETTMATKEHFKKLDDRLTAVESKVDGINHRLDTESMMRSDQKLPERVNNLEIELFGASKAPKST